MRRICNTRCGSPAKPFSNDHRRFSGCLELVRNQPSYQPYCWIQPLQRWPRRRNLVFIWLIRHGYLAVLAPLYSRPDFREHGRGGCASCLLFKCKVDSRETCMAMRGRFAVYLGTNQPTNRIASPSLRTYLLDCHFPWVAAVLKIS